MKQMIAIRQVPVMPGFEQVHPARRFGASNLVKTPFFGNYG
jgi:hypothetical protein